MTTDSISPILASLNQRAEPATISSNVPANIGAEFQQVLSSLILSQLSSPFGSSDDPSSSTGSDSLSMLMLFMNQLNSGGSGISSLLDQMNSGNNPYGLVNQLASQSNPYALQGKVSGGYALPTQNNAPQITFAQAQGLQINQFIADKQMGGDGINSNCGPASLAMVLRGLGLSLPGENSSTTDGGLVDLTRRMMVADPSRDGVDAKGRRADGELNAYTDFDDLARGVQAAGGNSQMIGENAASIRAALMSGARVIVSGTFVGKSPLPWTGDRGPDNHSAPGGATQHIIAVSAYDSQTNSFIINDPARLTTLRVSAVSLENFMVGNAGAMAVRQ